MIGERDTIGREVAQEVEPSGLSVERLQELQSTFGRGRHSSPAEKSKMLLAVAQELGIKLGDDFKSSEKIVGARLNKLGYELITKPRNQELLVSQGLEVGVTGRLGRFGRSGKIWKIVNEPGKQLLIYIEYTDGKKPLKARCSPEGFYKD